MSSLIHRFRRPKSSPGEQLAALLSVLDQAVAVAPATEAAVRACGAPGDVDGAVGHNAGELVGTYHRLRQELAGMPVDGERAALAARTEQLLQYHQWLLHNALHLAFSLTPDPCKEAMRRRLDGVGPPAAHLQALRDQVTTRLRDAS